MGLPRFYVPPERLARAKVGFEREDLAHLKARRVRTGDRISLFDGQGGEAVGLVSRVDRDGAEAEIVERPDQAPRTGPRIAVGLGLCRWERLRLALEKATELGAWEFWPLVTERSQPLGPGLVPKMERVVVESLKQCRRSLGPRVHEPLALDQALTESADFRMRLLLDQEGESLTAMNPSRPESVFLLAGPEGGLSDPEREAALSAGFAPLTLSSAVLRSETAVLAGLALVSALWERPLGQETS